MHLLFSTIDLLLFTLVPFTFAQQDGLATIYQNPYYSQLRPCGQGCFIISVGSTRDLLGSRLGCSISTLLSTRLPLNNCYCRSDLQSNADVILSSCVNSRCQFNTNDITSAQAVYHDYCMSNGYAAGGGQVSLKPTGSSNGGGQGVVNDGGSGSGPAPGATVGGGSLPTGASNSGGGKGIKGSLLGWGSIVMVYSIWFMI